MDTETGSYIKDARREAFKEMISIRLNQNLTSWRKLTKRRLQKDKEEKTRD
jgi:hypothetical protein